MDNNELLEKYYNERFKNRYDPAFKELSDEFKTSLQNTTEFAFYKAKLGFRVTFKAISDTFMKP